MIAMVPIAVPEAPGVAPVHAPVPAAPAALVRSAVPALAEVMVPAAEAR